MWSLVWYIGMVLNLPWLHSVRCIDAFNFLFSDILMLLLWRDILVLRACVDPMYIFYIRFLSWNLSLYSELCFWSFLKENDFSCIIILHTPHLLFLRLVTPYVVFFLNAEGVSILLWLLGCLLILTTFVVSNISLILSLFLCSFKPFFFVIYMNSSGWFSS